MSEILGALKPKEKIAIISVMSCVAVLLAVICGTLTYLGIDNHEHNYDYSLQMTESGEFNLLGVCNVENCEDPYFREDNVSGVKVLTASASTCTKSGNIHYAYTIGEKTARYIETLPLAPHTYQHTLVERDGKTTLSAVCTAEGCNAEPILEDGISDFKVVTTSEVTCFSPAVVTYSYTKGTEKHSFVSLSGEALPHTLNGKSVAEQVNTDGTYNYSVDGIKLIGAKSLACGSTGEAYFVCEKCYQIELVTAYQPHTFVYSESALTKPTASADGKAVLSCNNKSCAEKRTVTIPKITVGENASVETAATELKAEVVRYVFTSSEYGFTVEFSANNGKPLEHNYVLRLEPGEDGEFNLIDECKQPGCQNPVIVTENVKYTCENTSTCCSTGKLIVTHITADGREVVLEIDNTAYGPHNYAPGSIVSYPSFEKTGSIKLKCTNGSCTDTVTVELPMMDDSNSTLRDQDGTSTVYKYVVELAFVSHGEEYTCKVELLIAIN